MEFSGWVGGGKVEEDLLGKCLSLGWFMWDFTLAVGTVFFHDTPGHYPFLFIDQWSSC